MATLKLGTIKVFFSFNEEEQKIEKLTRADAEKKYSKGVAVFMFEGKPSDLGTFMRDAEEYNKAKSNG